MLLLTIQVHFWQVCQKNFRIKNFAVSTRKLNICGFFGFLFVFTRKLIFRIGRLLFWQAFQLFSNERLQTFRSKCKNDKSTFNVSKRYFFPKKSGGHVKWYFDNRTYFVLPESIKLTLKLTEKKTDLQESSFPRIVTVDKPSTLLTSLIKVFSQTLFCYKYEKTEIMCIRKHFLRESFSRRQKSYTQSPREEKKSSEKQISSKCFCLQNESSFDKSAKNLRSLFSR